MPTYPMKTKAPTKPPKPAGQRTKAPITIKAELVDHLFEETIANVRALQAVWEKISLKEELK